MFCMAIETNSSDVYNTRFKINIYRTLSMLNRLLIKQTTHTKVISVFANFFTLSRKTDTNFTDICGTTR
jgi:hypothetical protein